jgi:HAD superfamily hydrolase (TIGR01509 family)
MRLPPPAPPTVAGRGVGENKTMAIRRQSAQEERQAGGRELRQPAFLFDLDGTLIDSVYQHVVAWREALDQVGVSLAIWKLHRRIGMSGGLFVTALLRELETTLDQETLARLPALHAEAYARHFPSVRPLPGATDLLATLSEQGVPWAIATSGGERSARPALELVGLPPETPLVTRDLVRYAKPDPDLFLTAAERIGVDVRDSIVVGDSVWDLLAARRARALGLGLLSGGYGREELIYAGAFRVYEDPADLLAHLDEVGVRRPLQR